MKARQVLQGDRFVFSEEKGLFVTPFPKARHMHPGHPSQSSLDGLSADIYLFYQSLKKEFFMQGYREA